MSKTNIQGALKFADLSTNAQQVAISLFASNANLSSLSFETANRKEWSASTFPATHASLGTLPNSLFETSSSPLATLKAAFTLLSGSMPNMGSLNSSSLTSLDLRNTSVDFCSGTRTSWQTYSLLSCSLLNTNARNCASAYPEICLLDGCPNSTRPSTAFTCVDGVWTANGASVGCWLGSNVDRRQHLYYIGHHWNGRYARRSRMRGQSEHRHARINRGGAQITRKRHK